MLRNVSLVVFKSTLFLLFISSMLPWFLWDISELFIYVIGALISIMFFLINQEQFKVTRQHYFISLLLLITIAWIAFHGNIYGVIGQLFLFIIIILFINTSREIKLNILVFFTNGMAVLLSISLFFYILYLIGVPLPHSSLRTSELGYGGVNYYFFITRDVGEVGRFKSIFAEPGHLTMGLIPLLYINKLNWKNKSVFVFLIAELFTLSLAGYITLIVSVIIFSLSSSKNNRNARVLLISLIFFSVALFHWMSDDNIINKVIVSRLAINENSGTIVGDNRSSVNTQIYYDSFIKSSDFLIGMDSQKFADAAYGSAGYKVYLMGYGLIGVVLVVFLYFSYALLYCKYEVLGLFLIFMMLLYQNCYPFWFTVIFSYILGTNVLYNEKVMDIKIGKE